ncbi:MAG: thiol-disulfide oxidoreductase DCC family protein [Phyllobacterium sp.]
MRSPFSYRSDPAVPGFPDDRPILIFDGKCVLCSGFVRFILRADRRRHFRFLSAQSPLGAALYRHYGLVAGDYLSNMLLENGRMRMRSDGSLRVLELLGMPWSLARLLRLVPTFIRDRIYATIARNRLKWFGVRDACYMPEAQDADRFLQ